MRVKGLERGKTKLSLVADDLSHSTGKTNRIIKLLELIWFSKVVACNNQLQ